MQKSGQMKASPILKIALPAVVTNITVPLLGFVDTAVVGHMGKAEYIAAVAIGTMIFNMVYWLCGFLRMGTTGLVAQAYGASNQESQLTTLRQGLILGTGIALGMILLQEPLLHFALWLMQPEAEVARSATLYFRICIWGAPAMLASYVLTGWFVGVQDTRVPMWSAIIQNLLNIVCTILFVFVLGMGVSGVALGTVVGIYGGLAFAISKLPHDLTLWHEVPNLPALTSRPSPSNIKSFFRINHHIFLRTLCLVAVTVYFTSAGSRMGTLTLDANTLLMQFFIIYSYFTDGLANAAEALSGECVGQGDRKALSQIIRQLFRWGLYLAVVFTVLYVVGGGWFLGLLTNQEEVLNKAMVYLPWIYLIPLLAIGAFVWDGIFIGMTLTGRMFLSMFISALVFFGLWFALGNLCDWSEAQPLSRNHLLWFCFLAYLTTRSVAQTCLFPKSPF